MKKSGFFILAFLFIAIIATMIAKTPTAVESCILHGYKSSVCSEGSGCVCTFEEYENNCIVGYDGDSNVIKICGDYRIYSK